MSYDPVVACKPDNVLDRQWQKEISCQTLARYLEHQLTYEKLIKAQVGQKLPIVYPWDTSYNTVRLGYNRKYSLFPLGIIMCTDVKHVQQAIHFCSQYKLHFVVRSSGHSWTGFSLSSDIIIDVSELNEIKVLEKTQESIQLACWNRGKRFVLVGPGARLGQVVAKLSNYNLAINVGSCVSVAAAGLTLGGGISPSLIRKAGMTCDHLISARIVLASGKVITASSNENQDLFWALQGAGGNNFGVITELKLHPCPFRGAIVFRYEFSWKQYKHVVKHWQATAPFANPRLSCELDLRSPKFFPNPIEFKGQFEGSLKAWELMMKKDFPWLTSPPTEVKKLKTFAECAKFWALTTQSYQKINSLFYQECMSKETMKIYKEALENAVGPRDTVSFDAMRGHVGAIESTASAFPWRKSLFWNLNNGSTLNPSDLPEHEKWVDSLYEKLKTNFIIPPSYVNAPVELLSLNEQYLAAYYGENVKRLQQVKQIYDPENLFQFQQSIPLPSIPS